MNKKEIEKTLAFYNNMHALNNLMRTGWVDWGLEGVRCESVAEHTYSTCMLAIGMHSFSDEYKSLDISKILIMILMHDIEEVIIGDITRFQPDKQATRKERGEKAVNELLKDLPDKAIYLSLIDEFNQNQSPEAKFAKMCDKLQPDLQARQYEGNFNLSNVKDNILNDPKILEMNKLGFNKVSEYFIQHDYPFFSGAFKDIAKHLKNKN